MEAIEFFSTRTLYTIRSAIFLIPKVDNTNNIRQFRHISCCNVIYKVISKVIDNRLKPLIPTLIDTNQSLKGRTIQNNILINDWLKL